MENSAAPGGKSPVLLGLSLSKLTKMNDNSYNVYFGA